MSTVERKQSIIAEVTDMVSDQDLVHIQAFIKSLRENVVEDAEHWFSLPESERERMLAAVRNIDRKDGTWISNDEVDKKYRKWFD